MNKRGQLDIGEFNPMAVAAGIVCGLAVFAMMGNTGTLQVGLFIRIFGLLLGAVAGYFVFNAIMNR